MGIEVRSDGTRMVSSYPLVVPAVVGSALSLLSIAPMPYGYYQFSRFAITAMAIWALSSCFNRQRVGWSVAFGAIAVLYNPLIPIYMARESWALFNLLGGILFIVVGCRIKDSLEIAAHVPNEVSQEPSHLPVARSTEDVKPSLPTPPRIHSDHTAQWSGISVPAWGYVGQRPIPGSLSILVGVLQFVPMSQANDPTGQVNSSWLRTHVKIT